MANKTVTFSVRMPESLRDELRLMAELKGMTLNRFIVEEILLALNRQYYYCPECGRPVADMRIGPGAKIIVLQCPWCGHEWQIENDEEEY